MSIEGVISYADIYSETLTKENMKYLDDLGVEWQGRNVLDIRDEVCIKIIPIFAKVYQQTAQTNPAELPRLKAEIIHIFENLFGAEPDDEDEPSSLVYRFDPITGTYRELIGAEGGFFKSIGKGLHKAKKAVVKGVRETGRWVREHPVETAVIAAAVVVVAVTAGTAASAVAGAGAAAAGATSDDEHTKDENKESKPTYPPPNPPPLQSTSSPVSHDPIAPQHVNPISPLTPGISPQFFSSSNPLPQDPFPHPAFLNYSYEPSTAGSGSPSSYPAPLVVPTSLTHEPKAYSASPSITDIPKSSSYATFSKGTPTLANHIPKSSPPVDRYQQVEFSLSQPTGINPNALHSSLFPVYQEKISHPSSTTYKVTSASNPAQEELVTDFLKGFARGLPKGSVDSIKKIPSTIVNTVETVATSHSLLFPIVPNREAVSKYIDVYETISYLGTCSGSELANIVAPEVHHLFSNWDNLSLEQRGEHLGHCIAKYGTDFLLPIAAAKGVKVVGGVLKEASVLGKLEGVIGSGTKELEAIEAVVSSSKISNLSGTTTLLESENSITAHIGKSEIAKKFHLVSPPKLIIDKQSKHIPGAWNYKEGKGIWNHPNPEKLLQEYAGKGQEITGIRGQAGFRERVDFGECIGYYIDETGTKASTNIGIIHYSEKGAHIVPAKPK